jgi:hypothetical protein
LILRSVATALVISSCAMSSKQLSRLEKEDLCIQKVTELQTRWKNPIGPSDPDYFLNPSGYWDFIRKLPDDDLDKNIKDTVGQLRFEKAWDGSVKGIGFTVAAFIVLGLIGLLVFGIRQLIALF